MKKLRIDSILFIILLSVLGIANLLNFNKPTVSRQENRALKQKPELSAAALFNGSYTKDFDEYYSDTFILRDNLVKTSKRITGAMAFLGPDISLITTIDDTELPQNKPSGEPAGNNGELQSPSASQTPSGTEGPDETQTPAPTPTPEKEERTDFGDGPNVGYYLIVDGKAVQLFKFNKESFDYYAEILNKYKEKLGSGVKIYSMIPPTAGEFVQLKKYKGITDSQNDAVDYVDSKLDDSISSVNLFDALMKHKDEYIYFKTDHHWTALGAYYAYAAFMEGKGESPADLDRYEAVDLGKFLGSSYTKTLDKRLEENPDNIVAYKPFTNYEFMMVNAGKEEKSDVIDMKYADDITKKYLVFLSSGGANWSVIKTDVHNGKKILVVKDSFGNALVPFLLPHYEEIYVVDPRFYNIATTGNIVEFVKEKGINEVVFCIYMEDVNWHKFMTGVENMLGENS